MKPGRRGVTTLAALVAILIVLIAGIYVGKRAQRPPAEVPKISSATASAPSPLAVADFFSRRLNTPDGKTQPLTAWQGKFVVVNFWAPWCLPCREEMPALSRLAQRYRSHDVAFVGIALDRAENVRRFSTETPVDYPLLVAEGEGAELVRALGDEAMALPYTVVFDRAGTVRLRKLGRIREDELDALLQQLTAS